MTRHELAPGAAPDARSGQGPDARNGEKAPVAPGPGAGMGQEVPRDANVGQVEGHRARAIPMVDARLDSKDLFATGRIVTIAHGEQVYQLRLTAQNKLILTK